MGINFDFLVFQFVYMLCKFMNFMLGGYFIRLIEICFGVRGSSYLCDERS